MSSAEINSIQGVRQVRCFLASKQKQK